ncbi:MAG: acyl-CoA ligase (AMP-forming), exosortase A system-associated [Proteobacteria bacterium]|nr:acyl-CoA ligase (AMP-forming), exosortase A system-associated [Pseudomonadota bacterium]
MLLHDLVLSSANADGARPALIRDDEVLDYASLGNLLGSFAATLVELGIRPNDRVAVYLNKRIETVVAYFGTSYAGAVFVPVNPTLKPAQVQHILRDCDVSILVTTAAQAAGLSGILGECGSLRSLIIVGADTADGAAPASIEQVSWADGTQRSPVAALPVPRIDTDVAAILYTSGSTGKPKGVVLSHRNIVAGAHSVASYLKNNSDDRILAALPFSFDAGFSQLTTGFSVGASIVLLNYLLPADVVRAVARFGATGLTGVPSLWNRLARLSWPADAVESLRYIANTGGAMPTATLSALRDRLPRTEVYLMYGLTEAFRSTYLPPGELDARPTSIGKAIPNAEILVVNENGQLCGPGEPGELVHRGALVSLGYWNDPEKTAERFRPIPGQLDELPFRELAVWSGDTVVTDEEGFLYFVGRNDDMIKSSGYRISPTEVEEVIYATALVNECAALGIPHPLLGQGVVIVCQSDDTSDRSRDALVAACKSKLPGYMVPLEIQYKEVLPRNPNGKIDRKALAEGLAGLFDEPA